MRIRWTPTAAADLQNIYDYLKQHEPHLAQPTIIEIRKSARSLKKFPLRGRNGREEGTRELLQRRLPHIIAYRLKDGWPIQAEFGLSGALQIGTGGWPSLSRSETEDTRLGIFKRKLQDISGDNESVSLPRLFRNAEIGFRETLHDYPLPSQ